MSQTVTGMVDDESPLSPPSFPAAQPDTIAAQPDTLAAQPDTLAAKSNLNQYRKNVSILASTSVAPDDFYIDRSGDEFSSNDDFISFQPVQKRQSESELMKLEEAKRRKIEKKAAEEEAEKKKREEEEKNKNGKEEEENQQCKCFYDIFLIKKSTRFICIF